MPTLSNKIEALENAIVTRLQPIQVANIATVQATPQTNAQSKAKSIERIITVSFIGEAAGTQKLSSATAQDTTLSVEVQVQATRLRTSNNIYGVYDLIMLVKEYLLGFKTLAFTPLLLKSVEMTERGDTVFMASIMFEATTTNVQKEDSELQTLLEQITNNIYNGATIVQTDIVP